MGVQWSVGTMFVLDDPQQCDFCHEGRVITRKQQLAFRQWTVRGYIHCRAMSRPACATAAARYTGTRTIEEAVRREYEKLPISAKPNATGARS